MRFPALLKQFKEIRQMMRTVTGGTGGKMTRKMMRKMSGIPGLGSLMGGGGGQLPMPGGMGGGLPGSAPKGGSRSSGSKRQKGQEEKKKTALRRRQLHILYLNNDKKLDGRSRIRPTQEN